MCSTLSIQGPALVQFSASLYWHFCPPTAEEPLKYLLLGAHATCTACLPHFNLSCRSLSAYSSSMAGEPVKNPFSVAYWATPKTFLGLFSAYAVSPLAGMLDY